MQIEDLTRPDFIHWISGDNGLIVHISILSMLLLGGLGFPIPEDIPLVLAGVAAGKGVVSPYAIWTTCYFGVIVADQIVFWAGYFFGAKILEAGTKSKFLPSITPERVEEVREGLRKRRPAFIFLGRHLFPVRSVTFLTAGALKIPYLEFLISDAFAALISVTIVIALGYFLGETLTADIISHILKTAHWYLFGICVIALLFYLYKRQKKSRALNS